MAGCKGEKRRMKRNFSCIVLNGTFLLRLIQVVCLFGMFGAMRGGELAKLAFKDVSEQGNLFVVWVKNTKTKENRFFAITGPCCAVVKKYIELRAPDAETDKFFTNYQNGQCLQQVIGKQKFTKMPRRIAHYLELQNAEKYTGHSFRRSSASMYANAGAGSDAVKNLGGWKSAKVAEGYVVNSLSYKTRASDTLSSLLTEKTEPTTSATTSVSTSSPIISAERGLGSGANKKRKATSTIVSSVSPQEAAASTSATTSKPSISAKRSLGSGANNKRKATSTIVSSVSTLESVSHEIERSEPTKQTDCMSSQGYAEISHDDVSDAELMSFDVTEVPSKSCMSSEGYVQSSDDNIIDAELADISYEVSSSVLNSVQRNFSFANCNIAINFKQ